jgi:hypothetical protein
VSIPVGGESFGNNLLHVVAAAVRGRGDAGNDPSDQRASRRRQIGICVFDAGNLPPSPERYFEIRTAKDEIVRAV